MSEVEDHAPKVQIPGEVQAEAFTKAVSTLTSWLFTQDKLATASMLSSIVLFSAVVYGLFWIAPQQMAEIRAGYEKIEASHVAERAAVEARHREHFGEILRKWDDTVQSMERVTKMQSDIVRELILREQAKR